MKKQILFLLLLISSTVHPVKTLKELATRYIADNDFCFESAIAPYGLPEHLCEDVVDNRREVIESRKQALIKEIIETPLQAYIYFKGQLKRLSKTLNLSREFGHLEGVKEQHYSDLQFIISHYDALLEEGACILQDDMLSNEPGPKDFEDSVKKGPHVFRNRHPRCSTAWFYNAVSEDLIKLFKPIVSHIWSKIGQDKLEGNWDMDSEKIFYNKTILRNPYMFEDLLKNIARTNSSGNTALDYAINCGADRDALEKLKALGAKESTPEARKEVNLRFFNP